MQSGNRRYDKRCYVDGAKDPLSGWELSYEQLAVAESDNMFLCEKICSCAQGTSADLQVAVVTADCV